MVKAWGMETEDNREDSIIKVKTVSEQGNNQGRVALEQVVSEQADLGLRQVRIVSEQEASGQQDKAITMVGLVEIFNNSIR